MRLTGARKLVAFIIATAAAVFLAALGRLDQNSTDLLGWLFSAMVVGSVGEHWARRVPGVARALGAARTAVSPGPTAAPLDASARAAQLGTTPAEILALADDLRSRS